MKIPGTLNSKYTETFSLLTQSFQTCWEHSNLCGILSSAILQVSPRYSYFAPKIIWEMGRKNTIRLLGFDWGFSSIHVKMPNVRSLVTPSGRCVWLTWGTGLLLTGTGSAGLLSRSATTTPRVSIASDKKPTLGVATSGTSSADTLSKSPTGRYHWCLWSLWKGFKLSFVRRSSIKVWSNQSKHFRIISTSFSNCFRE